ncbi:MAG TPA: hypothetical protein VKB43_09305 [Gaiellaceae bacterium]|nr:hypothetical protein [Gaiellaceae bacterium]
MNDDLLTAFRSDVPSPDEAKSREIYARATAGRRRVSRRRLVLAVAVVAAAGIAGGLYASLGGAGANVNPRRQQIVNKAVAQVNRAFGDHRITKATLDGSLLTVDVPGHGPLQSTVGALEGVMLAHVVEDDLQAAGDEGIDTINVGNWGGGPLSPFPAQSQLPADACDIPADSKLADTTSASGRVIPLLGGFCLFRLTTAHPNSFDAETILNQLREAIPAADQGGSHHRAQVFEVYGENGKPMVVVAWAGGTNEGGSVYNRPGVPGLPGP